MNKGCLIFSALALLLLSFGLGQYFYKQYNENPEIYATGKPVRMDIVKKVVVTGTIKPRREVVLKSQVSGILESIFVETGELVKKGQKIGLIKLVPNQININNAIISVELATIRHQEALREREQQKIINEESLDISESKSLLENAKLDEKRQRELLESNVISNQEYEQTKLELDIRKAAYENALVSSVDVLNDLDAEERIRFQELETAKNNLVLLKEGVLKNSGVVSNVITSTIDGVVLNILIEEGSSVTERNNFNDGTSIALIGDMQSIIFEGKVDESEIGKLKEGMPLELEVTPVGNQTFDATLEYISPKGVEENRTVKFVIRAGLKQQQSNLIRAGYSAVANIVLDRKENVIAVNERDLIFNDSLIYVEIEKSEQEFEQKQIAVGISDGVYIEVTNGLDSNSIMKLRRKI